MPYRQVDDPALATFPLRTSKLFPFAWALTVPMAVFGLWLLTFALPRLLHGPLTSVLPSVLMGAVLVAMPWILWKTGEPYLAAGPSPALRLFRDRVEVAAPRARSPLRMPLDRLTVHRSTTVVRHVTGITLNQASFVHLRVPGILRIVSTRTFETPEAADQVVAQILCLQATGRLAPEAAAPAVPGAPTDDAYEARLQAELERLRRS